MADEMRKFDFDDLDKYSQNLSPIFQQLRGLIEDDRKTLLKSGGFETGKELKQYLAQYVYPRLDQLLVVLALGNGDAYMMAAGAQQEIAKLRQHGQHGPPQRSGAVDDRPDLRSDYFDGVRKAIYGLGSVVKERPDDAQLQAAYGKLADEMDSLTQRLLEEAEGGPFDDSTDDSGADDGGADERIG